MTNIRPPSWINRSLRADRPCGYSNTLYSLAIMSDEIRDLIEKRLVELEDEAGKLRRALDQLTPTRGRGRSAGSGNASAVSTRRPRRKRAAPGERQRQLIDAIRRMPGATANELAHALDLGPTQIYGLVRSLEKKRTIRKKGHGFKVLA